MNLYLIRSYRGIAVGLGVLLVSAMGAACGGAKQMAPPCQGEERCDCYPNGTCNATLVCLSNLCVASVPTGSGGTTGSAGASGGAGTAGSAGTGIAGATGSAGVSGGAGTGGGAGTTGSAGTTGGAGTTGAGGSSAPGQNLIKNGDFSLGKTYWDLTYQAGEIAGSEYANGEYCVLNLSTSLYLSFSLGYPPTPSDAFVIEPGASYTLTYRARFQDGGSVASFLPSVTTKIGHAQPPYTGLVMFTGDSIVVNYSTYTHTFNGGTGDTGAGLVFNGTLDYFTEVCFDDVKLVKN